MPDNVQWTQLVDIETLRTQFKILSSHCTKYITLQHVTKHSSVIVNSNNSDWCSRHSCERQIIQYVWSDIDSHKVFPNFRMTARVQSCTSS